MRGRSAWIPMLALLLLLAGCQAVGKLSLPGAPAAAAPTHELRVGDKAPDFTLVDQSRQPVTLSQFRGRPVQVAFYVWAFSGG